MLRAFVRLQQLAQARLPARERAIVPARDSIEKRERRRADACLRDGWRIGIGHGPWQFEEEWPGSLSAEEIENILQEMRNVEKQRCLRYKPEMRFEYRVVDRLVEMLRERVVCQN